MKFCQPHWNRLRYALQQKGMGDLGAKTGEELVEKSNDPNFFDPLMAAHNRILEMFLEPLKGEGLYIFTGDYCPLCELIRLNPRPSEQQPIDENWIEGVTKDLQQYCIEKNLITPPN